jgi:hypothetical protein
MIQRGMYVDQIHRFDRYYDRDQIKVILYEDLRRKTKEAVQDVYRFLNVDPSFSPDSVGEHNVTRYPESVQVYHWLRLSWQPMRDLADAWVPRLTTMVRRFARKLLFSTDRPEMKERDRRYLRTIYSEPNSHLEDRIGRDLSHWK